MITGATGFAGSFLVEDYASRGWQVTGTYREPAEDRSWVPAGVALHPIDLLDAAATARLVAGAQPDLVHHLAAQSSVAAAWSDPLGTLRDNAAMQYNLLEAVAATARHARVLIVGSCDEYGNVAPTDNPVTEAQELRPINPYALSKVVQDLMGYEYAAIRGLSVVRVRPFLQLGPRRPARFAVGSFARQIAEIELGLSPPVIEVGNVDLRRDFTDVRDVARACALAAESGKSAEVYNIASGVARSLRDLIAAMLRAVGVEAQIRQSEKLQRALEPPVLIGDASRLRDATGWAPTISFEQSIIDTLTYWRDRIARSAAIQGDKS